MIFDKITQHYTNNLPLVAYRKPNEEKLLALFQETDKLFFSKNYTESGFVFAPFDDKENTILIPLENSEYLNDKLTLSEQLYEYEDNRPLPNGIKNHHINLVEKAIKAIENKVFNKVVLSRKELVGLKEIDPIVLFKRLLTKYTSAFVYLWFHPKVGLWLGATPETLVTIKNSEFRTMSLAGTQVYKGSLEVVWQQKELEEQAYVTDYILDKLSKITDNLQKKTLRTVRAGNLVHLQTNISGKLTTSVSELIQTLHPTPAVCGMPKTSSKTFIMENEGYDREFYTGFLGELNFLNGQSVNYSELVVNLRCMQIIDHNVCIYVGGGITKDSYPLEEFEETVAKSLTMKSIFRIEN